MRPRSDPAPSPAGANRTSGPGVRVAFQPDLAPGENARGEVSGAAWSYLLPDRDLGTILSLGEPTAPTMAALEQIGREVIVAPNGQLPGCCRSGASAWWPFSIHGGPTAWRSIGSSGRISSG